MEDYPNNDTLITVINAIDQNKQDKITGTLNQIASFDINGNLISKDLDNSLSKEGAPADAKAVGDAFSELVGDVPVATQISDAINNNIKQSDWNQMDSGAIDFIKNKPGEATDDEIAEYMAILDMFPVISDTDGFILTDENNAILLV